MKAEYAGVGVAPETVDEILVANVRAVLAEAGITIDLPTGMYGLAYDSHYISKQSLLSLHQAVRRFMALDE